MYQSYWGLASRPFDQRDEERFFYPSETHHAALAKLRYSIEHGGSVALAGPSGTGKSLIAAMLLRQLADQGFVVVRIAFPLLTHSELLAYVAGALAREMVPFSPTTLPADQSLRLIESSLAQLGEQGKRLLMAMDDVHAVESTSTLTALRLLLNLGNAERTAPALMLVGQTRLLQMVARMPSLDERLTAKSLLASFGVDETAAYIAHRLHAAGASREIFDHSAIEAVHAFAQGVPRRINRLCDLALFVGFAEERQTIAADQIEAIAEELISVPAAQAPANAHL
jgi:general secretion pathway protein A